MIQQVEQAAWQQSLQCSITDWSELCGLLELDPAALPLSQEAMGQFPLRISREYVARIQPKTPNDPLLLQILPAKAEMAIVPGYTHDPLAEDAANPVPGLLHKYHGRVLLTVAGSCPINCRYCFRRHFPYQKNVTGRAGWRPMLDYIAKNTSIKEVILSGGEPLMLKDEVLADLINQIEKIKHVKFLRFHTRMPIVIPSRITNSMLDLLKRSRLSPVIVLHCNHPNEIDAGVRMSIMKMKNAGIQVLNQSVLLRKVNDDAETLIHLSEKLFSCGCLPYYIHLLDKVSGAAHFAVSETRAKELQAELQSQLPGYLVPKFVKEVPSEKHKVQI